MNESSASGNPSPAAHDRTQRLIVALAAALTPTRPAPGRRVAALGWIFFAFALTAIGTLVTGPMRPDWRSDTMHTGFALQLALGAAAGLACLLVGLEHDVPGARRRDPLRVLAALLGVAWIVTTGSDVAFLHDLGLASPSPSMIGKREHCLIEGLALALAPALAALALLAGRAVRPRFMGGAWLGFAAGLFPALAMQLACMLDPAHALWFHVPAAFASALAAGLAARFVLPRG